MSFGIADTRGHHTRAAQKRPRIEDLAKLLFKSPPALSVSIRRYIHSIHTCALVAQGKPKIPCRAPTETKAYGRGIACRVSKTQGIGEVDKRCRRRALPRPYAPGFSKHACQRNPSDENEYDGRREL